MENGRDAVTSVWDCPSPWGKGSKCLPGCVLSQAVCSDSEKEPEGRAVQEGARLHLSRHARQRRNRHSDFRNSTFVQMDKVPAGHLGFAAAL